MKYDYLELLGFLDTNVCYECPYELNDDDCQECSCKANRDTIMNAIIFYEKFKMHRDVNDVPDTTRPVIAYQRVSKEISESKALSVVGAYYKDGWYYPGTNNKIKNVISWREMIHYDDR